MTTLRLAVAALIVFTTTVPSAQVRQGPPPEVRALFDAIVAAANAGRYLVVKVNTDAVPELGDRFGIRSIPTMAVFVGGREVSRTAGARPAADIEAFVRQAAGTR